MSGVQPDGYFDFVMPPLEGLWWFKGDGVITDILDKDNFHWTSLIRQPDFVIDDVFQSVKLILAQKKPDLDLSRAWRLKLTEGLRAQIMHIGAYDDEPATIAALERFIGCFWGF